jgi:hypothetical protein
MTNDMIALVANVALTLSFLFALIFGIAQVRAAARDRRERMTLDALRNFQTPEFVELMQYVIFKRMPRSRKEFERLPDKEQVLFLRVAQGMEMLGILVAERYINLDLVEKTLGSFVTQAWEKLEKLTLSVRPSDPFVGEYFQWLAQRISERMTQRPRKPFHELNVRLQ